MATQRAPARVRSWLTSGSPVRATRHRDVQGSAPRAAVLGLGDGLITNLSLILGIAAASTNASAVRLVGIAGLLAGAFSMAAGELVSVRTQHELRERELQVEREELAEAPDAERRELAAMYRARGVPPERRYGRSHSSANVRVALDTHARLELGIDPDTSGSARQAGVVSFVAFGVGALLPLLPWFFGGGTGALLASIVIGAVAALILGGVIGALTERGVVRTAFRQLAVVSVAAAVTYGVGSLLGVSTS